MRVKLSYILVSLLIIVGCRRGSYYSDRIDGLNYQQYTTYAWLPTADTAMDNGFINNEILIENVRQAADREMEARGFTVNTENPDVLLLVHTMFERRQELVRSAPLYSSYGYYHPGFYTGPMHPFYYNRFYTMPFISGYDIRQVDYTEGSVVVDMIEKDTNRLIWRGWMEKRIDNPQRMQRNIPDHVCRIFRDFPLDKDDG
ncbi:MAG: DUF4136 domain-containing protein [Cytophagaceae bacterium]